MEKIDEVIFYTIDKAIKTYRQYAQEQLKQAGLNMTIDQWLVIRHIDEMSEISQQELAEKVFKDNASVTRIIELLVTRGYLKRSAHKTDGRRARLLITAKGKDVISKVSAVVQNNRNKALNDISPEDLNRVKGTLNDIIENCKM